MDLPEDPLDLPLIPFDSGENSYELQNPGIDRLVLGPDNEDSDMEDDPLSAHEEESNECLPSGGGSDSEEDDSDDDISVISADNDIRQSVQRAKRVSFPVSCRGISWFINTTGCRRAVLLILFNDVGFIPGKYSLTHNDMPICCDAHLAAFREVQQDNEDVHLLLRLLPSADPVRESDPVPESQMVTQEYDAGHLPVQHQHYTKEQRLKVREALREIRLQIWEELAGGNPHIPYSPYKFIPDTYIERIVASCPSLTTVDQLKTQLAKTSKVSTLLEPYLPRILAAAAKAYTDSIISPRPIGHPPKRQAVIPAENPYAAEAPASISPPPNGIPADIYHLRSIPPELWNSLPPLEG